jgi:large subunit ribosomal protein L31
MKKNIHPTMRPTVFIDVSTNDKIITSSALTVQESMEIDGVTYQVVRTDITSYSHPFFTGEVRFVDERGTVERFKEKIKKAQASQAQAAAKAAKNQKQVKPAGDPKSYRDVLREQQDTIRTSAKTTEQA